MSLIYTLRQHGRRIAIYQHGLVAARLHERLKFFLLRGPGDEAGFGTDILVEGDGIERAGKLDENYEKKKTKEEQ